MAIRPFGELNAVLYTTLDDHAKKLSDDAFVYLKQNFGQHWRSFKEKMSYPYEYFKSVEDYEKPIEELQVLGKEANYSNLNNR